MDRTCIQLRRLLRKKAIPNADTRKQAGPDAQLLGLRARFRMEDACHCNAFVLKCDWIGDALTWRLAYAGQ